MIDCHDGAYKFDRAQKIFKQKMSIKCSVIAHKLACSPAAESTHFERNDSDSEEVM